MVNENLWCILILLANIILHKTAQHGCIMNNAELLRVFSFYKLLIYFVATLNVYLHGNFFIRFYSYMIDI